jgi:hypothetical protein
MRAITSNSAREFLTHGFEATEKPIPLPRLRLPRLPNDRATHARGSSLDFESGNLVLAQLDGKIR